MAFAVSLAARPPLFPFGLESRGRKVRLMLRTGQLLPPLRLLTLRFDAGRFPPTPVVCYPAPWRLPGPDLHRLANITFGRVRPGLFNTSFHASHTLWAHTPPT